MIFDVILVALLFFSAISGWRSGAFGMLVSVIVLVASLLLASEFATNVGALLHLGPTWAQPVIGFVLAFIALMIVGGWIRGFFRPKHGLLRGIDGMLGAALGVVRGALLLGIVFALLELTHLSPEHFTEHSRLLPLLIRLAAHFATVLRPYLHVSFAIPSVNV